MAVKLPFVCATYQSQSPVADNARCVNWYVETPEGQQSKAKVVWYPTPGYALFATCPEPVVRGLYTEPSTGRVFAVAGGGLYEISSACVVTLRSLVADDGLPAQFASNGDIGGQMLVASGGVAYLLVLATNVVTTVLASGAQFIGFIDGYFVALDATTSTLQVSDLADGATWPALSVAQRSVASDPWVSMVVSDRKIHLHGSQTSESWYNNGDPDFPFAYAEGSLVRDGSAGPYSSVALVDNSRIWLTANEEGTGVVKRSSGYQTVRISTEAVETAIQSYTNVSDAVAWSYQDQGHTFYVLNFPTMRATWVYDAKTNLWHERGWWNTSLMRFDSARGRCHCYGHGQHLVGDRLTGGVYTQSIALYEDIGSTELRRLGQGPHIYSNGAWIYFPEIRVEVETGFGLTATREPQIMLQWSDDSGKTWSDEHWTGLGNIGDYKHEAVWRRCGRSRDRIFRVVISDPVPCRIVDMYAGV